jgi:hypothetical protein
VLVDICIPQTNKYFSLRLLFLYLQGIGDTVRQAMCEAHLANYKNILKRLAHMDGLAGVMGRQERQQIVRNVFLDDPKTLMCRLPSASWLSKMITIEVLGHLEEMEGCLAAVDAGRHGFVKLDWTYATAKGVRGYKCVFTGINGDGEPLFGAWALGDGLPEVHPLLEHWRDGIKARGGQEPQYIYVDWYEGLCKVLTDIFPNALICQDLWHVFDRYSREVP